MISSDCCFTMLSRYSNLLSLAYWISLWCFWSSCSSATCLLKVSNINFWSNSSFWSFSTTFPSSGSFIFRTSRTGFSDLISTLVIQEVLSSDLTVSGIILERSTKYGKSEINFTIFFDFNNFHTLHYLFKPIVQSLILSFHK